MLLVLLIESRLFFMREEVLDMLIGFSKDIIFGIAAVIVVII